MFRKYFLNISLNKKLVLMMLFLTSLLLSMLFFLYVNDEKKLIDDIARHTADLSKVIQIGAQVTRTKTGAQANTGKGTPAKAAPGNENALQAYLKNLKPKGINEISIIGNNNLIIASSNPKKVGSAAGAWRKELVIMAQLGYPVSKDTGRKYSVILPVVAGKTHYGYIHLIINEQDFSRLLRRNLEKKMIAALVVFLLGSFIAVFLSSRYTKPINEISLAAGKVAAGDFSEIRLADRKDEIGMLTRSFNSMVKRLKENRRLEEKLREAEHLSAVGQLSRSMAHEIRNPLNFISLSIDYIKDNYAPGADAPAGQGEKFDALVSGIKGEIFRLDKLVRDFLDYGKPLKLNMKQANIGRLMDEVAGLIKARAESQNVRVIKRYGYTPSVLMDPDFVKTCIFNIVLNAFQAMPHGGSLTLETRKEDECVSLGISDTGPGVPPEHLAKVFEPFFTTKSEGLGLGLATTKRIIEEHGGEISFESVQGKGSRVILKLPVAKAPAERPLQPAGSSGGWHPKGLPGK
ncbi:MAG: HAMP domain-containing sensor histidine kinase [Desulfobacteraceae bacterium]|nr:HAMP domain-containing sensor histidine kinase [Desulfobacteraceae bacterium]